MPTRFTRETPSVLRSGLRPPRWARTLVGDASRVWSESGFEIEAAAGADASLVTLALPDAADLEAKPFEDRVAAAYRVIRGVLGTLGHSAPIRFWNHLPQIHQTLDDGRDRYVAFNAGRFTGLREWFGGADRLPGRLPAASGVGHRGDEMVIHCLAFDSPAVMLENPRQVPAFQYSARYGALPPCFARGSIISHPSFDRAMLVAAGTASILGEVTVHPGDVAAQLDETLSNLKSLLAAARGPGEPEAYLTAFTDVRIYHLHEADAPAIRRGALDAFGPAASIELVHADLCRQDLLVEVEGLAQLGGERRA